MAHAVAIAILAAGTPENRGRAFAAEGAVLCERDGPAFVRQWVQGRTCPRELGLAAGRAPSEPFAGDESALATALLDWIGERDCWALDPAAARRWLEHWAEGLHRSAPRVLDVTLAAGFVAPGSDTATAADLARSLGRLQNTRRPAGAFRATEVVRCLAGVVSAFEGRAQKSPGWARFVRESLSRPAGDGVLQRHAAALAEAIDLLRSPLFSTPGNAPADPSPDDRERWLIEVVKQAGPTYRESYVTEPRPPLGQVPSSTEELASEVERIFSAAVPAVFGQLAQLTGEAAREQRQGTAPAGGAGAQASASAGVLFDDAGPRRKRTASELEKGRAQAEATLSLVSRPSQRDMALAVSRALGDGRVLLADAETGTGKTLAYIVPAALAALRVGKRVVVSTYTRALQDQIAKSDAGKLRSVLRQAGVNERDVRLAIVKGASNYACLPALVDALLDTDDRPATRIARVIVLSAVLFGDYGELPDVPLEPDDLKTAVEALNRRVRSTGQCKRHRKGNGLPRCPHEVAREAAAQADIVVGNHAWLLHQELNDSDVVVVDEAEQLATQAEGHFATGTATWTLRRLATEVGNGEGSVLGRLAKLFATAPELAQPVVERFRQVGARVRELADGLDRALSDLVNRAAKAEGNRTEEFEFGAAERTSAFGVVVAGQLGQLRATLAELPAAFKAARELIAQLQATRAQQRTVRALERQLAEVESDASEALHTAEAWETGLDTNSWALLGERGDRGGWRLDVEPLLVGPRIADHFEKVRGLVFCSASLSVGGDLRLFKSRTGIVELEARRREVRSVRFPSPFDYEQALRIGIATDVPRDGQPRLATLADAIVFTAERTRGRLLALFSSIDEMRQVHRRVAPRLESLGLPVYVATAENADAVARRFRAEVHSVALGVKSFWYGVDFPGETLEWLFVAKIPYERRTTLLLRRMNAVAAAYGIDAEADYYSTLAMLMLKQGAGRVIRQKSDRGTVVMFDNWLARDDRLTALRQVLPEGTSRDTAEVCRPGLDVGSLDKLLHEALLRHGLGPRLEEDGLSTRFRPAPERWPGPRPPAEAAAPADARTGPVGQEAPQPLEALVATAGDAFANGDAGKAWQLLQPEVPELSSKASASKVHGRGLLVAARAAIDAGAKAEGIAALRRVARLAETSLSTPARRHLLEALTGLSGALDAWRAGLPEGTDQAALREIVDPAAEPEHDPELAAWQAVLGFDAPSPARLSAWLARAESNSALRLAAYVTACACICHEAVADDDLAQVVALVRSEMECFGLPPAQVSRLLLAVITGTQGERLRSLVPDVLATVDPPCLAALPIDAVLDIGEAAGEFADLERVQMVSEELDRRLDEGAFTPQSSRRALGVAASALHLAITRNPHAVAEALRQVTVTAESLSLQAQGESVLGSLGTEGWSHERQRLLVFMRAHLAAQTGEEGQARAVQLLVQEAAKRRAREEFAEAATALDQAWLLTPDAQLVAEQDALLRRAAPQLPAAPDRVEQSVRSIPPGRYVVVGGDGQLAARLRQRVPASVELEWVVCEQGQRPNFSRVDALLASGRFDRVVLLVHHVSHALSAHVTRQLNGSSRAKLVVPALPGMSGMLMALAG